MTADPAAAAHPGAEVALTETAATVQHRDIAARQGWQFVNLDDPDLAIPAEVSALMEAKTARLFTAIPVAAEKQTVWVAVGNPNDPVVMEGLRRNLTGRTVRLVYANPAALRRIVETTYSAAEEATALAREAARARSASTGQASAGGDIGRVTGDGDSAMSQVLGLIIEQGLREGASDIHIESERDHVAVRYRVDGDLHQGATYARTQERALLTKIKVDAQMRTDNFLVPDSGVMQYQAQHGPVDIRVEVTPSAWGSNATLRLQDNVWRPLSSLGFSAENERRFRTALAQPYGLIFFVGPTSSGKTTSMYSGLREKIDPRTKIVTLEDPVEYKVPAGVTQVPIRPEQGMTFEVGGRSLLRQNPNVVMIGEARDTTTAAAIIDAASQGHLAFSTLHTNDAPDVVNRLSRMGIEPYLVATTLLCVVGQRLVRRLCPDCKQPTDWDVEDIEENGFSITGLPEHGYAPNPEGCENCFGGYSGRIPLHEVMLVGTDMRDAIEEGASKREIRRLAAESGMTTMRQDGFEKVKAGLTTVAMINTQTLRDF